MKKLGIPFWNVNYGDEDIEAVGEAIKNNRISQGKITAELERNIADIIDVEHVIMVSSGSMALTIALYAIGVGCGDEVIIPSKTWIATLNAVVMLGGVPILIDTQEEIPIIDTSKIEEAITEKTKAIIPVHLNGLACEMQKITKLASERGLYVIEDAAQAFYCKVNDKYLGTIGDIGCFSLSLSKLISSGQGGFCTTNNHDLAQKLKSMRTHGLNDIMKVSTWNQQGNNFRYNDILASICKAQMRSLGEKAESCLNLNMIYREGITNKDFKPVGDIRDMKQLPIYNEFILNGTREKWKKRLDNADVEARLIYPCLSTCEYINNRSTKHGPFKNSERFGRHGIYLPGGPDANIDKIKELIVFINSFD